MDHNLLQRIVLIGAFFESHSTQWGTGFRLAPGRVLTAQHVVQREKEDGTFQEADKLSVGLDAGTEAEGPREARAKLLWRGEPKLDIEDLNALDVALLEDELPDEGLEPFRKLVPMTLGDRGQWETRGFAFENPESKSFISDYLWGACHPAGERASHVALTVEREPPRDPKTDKVLAWTGLSGAPISFEPS